MYDFRELSVSYSTLMYCHCKRFIGSDTKVNYSRGFKHLDSKPGLCVCEKPKVRQGDGRRCFWDSGLYLGAVEQALGSVADQSPPNQDDERKPMKLNGYLAKSTIVAALGGLLFGFDTGVISGTTSGLTATYNLSPFWKGFTVAAALWGTVIGALLAGIPGDKHGRRDSLRLMAVLYLLSAIGCAGAWSWTALVIFRFIGGLGIGGSSVLGPMYIAEISPASWRGRLVGFFQFNVVFGILVAYLSNYLIGIQQFGAAEWRWDLGVSAIPAAFFLAMLFTIPRSPRWLVKKQKLDEAGQVLKMTGEADYETQLQAIAASIDAEHGHADEPLFSGKYRLPIFLA